jgi:hypothetical protein
MEEIDVEAIAIEIHAQRPLSAAAARQLIDHTIDALTVANNVDPRDGAVARRRQLAVRLAAFSEAIQKAGLDSLPNSAAGILERSVIRGLVEYRLALRRGADIFGGG